MQADLDSQVSGEPVSVHYAYAARYAYSDVVLQNDNFLMVSAYTDRYQTAKGCRVETRPTGRDVEFSDRMGNTVHRVRITVPHRELVIAVIGQAYLGSTPSSVADVPLSSIEYSIDAEEFLAPSPLVDPAPVALEARTIAAGLDSQLEAVRAVINWVSDEIEYERGATSVSTTAAQVLASMKGVCQDKTHLALGMMRALGIPARYVSGLLTRQAGETHSWVEFLHPEAGWLPADPTRRVVMETGTDYLKFAVGRDYSEVPPVSGSFVSKGIGGLDVASAQVYFDRDDVSFEDAMMLIAPDQVQKRLAGWKSQDRSPSPAADSSSSSRRGVGDGS